MPGEFELEQYFPGLLEAPCRVTSPTSLKYNCIAWAAGDSTRWWWPRPEDVGYWPDQVPMQETIESFCSLFQFLGFEPCDSFFASSMTSGFILRSPSDSTALTRTMPSGSVWTSSASASAESLSPRMPSARAAMERTKGSRSLSPARRAPRSAELMMSNSSEDTLLPALVFVFGKVLLRRGMFQVAVIVER